MGDRPDPRANLDPTWAAARCGEIPNCTSITSGNDDVAPVEYNLDGAALEKQAQFVKQLAARQHILHKHQMEVNRQTHQVTLEAAQQQRAYTQKQIGHVNTILAHQHAKNKQAFATGMAQTLAAARGSGINLAGIKMAEEAKRQAEQAARERQAVERELHEARIELERMQRQLESTNPIAAAERNVKREEDNVKRVNDVINEKNTALFGLKNTPEGLLLDNPEQHPISYQKKDGQWTVGVEIKKRSDLDKLLNEGAKSLSPFADLLRIPNGGQGQEFFRAAENILVREWDRLRQRILNRKNEIIAAQQALDQANREKLNAESNLNSARQAVSHLKAKVEADAKAKAEAETKAKVEAEAKAKAEADAKAKAESEAKAKAEEETKAKAEAEAKAKVEAEAKAKAEAEAKAKAEAEAKAKAEADAKAKAESDAKAKAESEAKAKTEAEAKAKTEAEAKAKAEAEAEAEAKAKAESETKAKAEAEAKAKAESETKAKAEAEAKAKAESEAKTKAEADANPNAEADATKKTEKEENEAVKNAVKFTADFYKDLADKFGESSSKVAKELAGAAEGKQIRGVDDALKAFDKYKDVLNKKFSVADREAIAKAFESLDRDEVAKNLAKFAKGFGIVSDAIDFIELYDEIKKGFATGEWKGAILKAESIAVGKSASFIVAFTFGAMAVTPIGILGFAVMMAVTSALIDDDLMELMNQFIFNL